MSAPLTINIGDGYVVTFC